MYAKRVSRQVFGKLRNHFFAEVLLMVTKWSHSDRCHRFFTFLNVVMLYINGKLTKSWASITKEVCSQKQCFAIYPKKLQSRIKFVKQCQEIKQNWTGWENLDICFCVIWDSTKFLLLERRLCLRPFLRFFQYFLIF